MIGSVLHVLAQRPALTGSGVTAEALVREAAARGWRQHVLVGVPSDAAAESVGGLGADSIDVVRFAPLDASAVSPPPDLPFPVAGMSDVMPYPCTRYRDLSAGDLDLYRAVWRRAFARAAEACAPDVIHVHHAWLVASLVKDVLPGVPVVVHCHATCLRQLRSCPDLAAEIRRGCTRNELFAVLHTDQAREYAEALAIEPARIRVVGGGYRDDLFHAEGRRAEPRGETILYAGKLSRAKGVPVLIESVRRLARERPGLRLHIAGSGAGSEGDEIRASLLSLGAVVVDHGRVAQLELAELMRESSVLVLPSYYEGLPLVVVEALASGCRVVSTDLPGLSGSLSAAAAGALELVARPGLRSVDEPLAEDLPRFTEELTGALARALDAPPLMMDPRVRARALEPYTWSAVFERVASLWQEVRV